MIVPGLGQACVKAAGEKMRLEAPYHVHVDSKGALYAFVGKPEECPDFRKARTAAAIRRGEKI